jgi:hypothetical protein
MPFLHASPLNMSPTPTLILYHACAHILPMRARGYQGLSSYYTHIPSNTALDGHDLCSDVTGPLARSHPSSSGGLGRSWNYSFFNFTIAYNQET